MITVMECNKVCLKADEGKILFKDTIGYTPKVYLYNNSNEHDWIEVDISEAVFDEELTDIEAKAAAYDILMGVSE